MIICSNEGSKIKTGYATREWIVEFMKKKKCPNYWWWYTCRRRIKMKKRHYQRLIPWIRREKKKTRWINIAGHWRITFEIFFHELHCTKCLMAAQLHYKKIYFSLFGTHCGRWRTSLDGLFSGKVGNDAAGHEWFGHVSGVSGVSLHFLFDLRCRQVKIRFHGSHYDRIEWAQVNEWNQ